MKLSGFMVVGPALCAYRGIDREPWNALHQEYYAGHLRSDLANVRKDIYENGLDFSNIEVTQNLMVAQKVMNWMQSAGYEGEIVALYSATLEARKGRFFSDVEKVLGFDIYSFGDWSLIKAGVVDSEVMGHWRSRLNQNLLFDCEHDTIEFVEEYLSHIEMGALEQLTGGSDFPIEAILVGTVNSP